MSVEQFILHHLTEKGIAEVPYFGTFSLKKTVAIFDENTKIFSPPAQQIIFHADEHTQGKSLINAFSIEKNITTTEAQEQIKSTVEHWKEKLNNGETFVLEKFGRFIRVGNETLLQGEKISKNNPDFYGLETLNINSLKKENRPLKKHGIKFILVAIIILLLVAAIIINKKIFF